MNHKFFDIMLIALCVCVCVSVFELFNQGTNSTKNTLWEVGKALTGNVMLWTMFCRESLGLSFGRSGVKSAETSLRLPNSPDRNLIVHLWDVLDKQVRFTEAPLCKSQDLKDLLLSS